MCKTKKDELIVLINDAITSRNTKINEYVEGSPNSRFKSWEWCHLQFKNEYKKYHTSNNKENIVDKLSLGLGFYLSSYGMYRGSTFIFKCDYKIHKEIVEIILDEKYDILWDYDPLNDEECKAKDLIFNKKDGIFYKIKESYEKIDPQFKPTNTLITKILMGTFGCIPAFDEFFKKGIREIDDCFKNRIMLNSKTFSKLCKFALENKEILKITSEKVHTEYPLMKCLDIAFWEIGVGKEENKKADN